MAAFAKRCHSLLVLARSASLLVAMLVLIWAFRFRTSFLPSSSTSKTDSVYSVLHPLLMVIGFIIVSGEAILIHKSLPRGSRNFRKAMHLSLQAVALGLGFFGIWIKFHKFKGFFANFYSLHSWMGLMCMVFFVAQWIVGFMSFWHRGEAKGVRLSVLPWHVYFGLYTYALSVATAETGLLEKITFLEAKGLIVRHSAEYMVVNFLGLGLSLLGALVIVAAVCQNPYSIITQIVGVSFAVTGFPIEHCALLCPYIPQLNNVHTSSRGHHIKLAVYWRLNPYLIGVSLPSLTPLKDV